MNAPQTIVVDPITRIEGHLRIEAETDAEGRITRASSAGTMVRGIEIILRGRDPRDAWAFAQRICGVCTVVHAVASCRAVEDALDIHIPANANSIRNLVLGMQFVQPPLRIRTRAAGFRIISGDHYTTTARCQSATAAKFYLPKSCK